MLTQQSVLHIISKTHNTFFYKQAYLYAYYLLYLKMYTHTCVLYLALRNFFRKIIATQVSELIKTMQIVNLSATSLA
jgi:hypothetical protein